MLAATRLLLDDGVPYALRDLAARGVIAGGDRDDHDALLERMLVAPDHAIGWALMALGTRETGERLLDAFVAGDRLKEGAPDVLLQALGYLGVEAAEPALWAAVTDGDHAANRSASLGLAQLPCVGREGAIADAIRACHGRALFAEFTPVLACKVGDPDLLAPLFAPGAPTSTDCFGGVLLGLALQGARSTFEALLFDPYWEATDRGTGNLGCCWIAVRILGLSIRRLLGARRDALTDDDLAVIADLACMRATRGEFVGVRAAVPSPDDPLELYRDLFAGAGAPASRARPGRGHRPGPEKALAEARAALAERIAARLAHAR